MSKIEVELDELAKYIHEYSALKEHEGEVVSQIGGLMKELAKMGKKDLELTERFFRALGIHPEMPRETLTPFTCPKHIMKTLKDLSEGLLAEKYPMRTAVCSYDELRDVAKELIKNTCWEDWLHTQKCPTCKDELEYHEGDYRCNNCDVLFNPVELWIRYFFNLEE